MDTTLNEGPSPLSPFSVVPPQLPENVAAWLREEVQPGAAALGVWIYATDFEYAPLGFVDCRQSGCSVQVPPEQARCERHALPATEHKKHEREKQEAWRAAYDASAFRSVRLDRPNFGADRDGFECILPLTLPPDFEPIWIESALASVGHRGHALSGELQSLMAASLAPSGMRADGLPAYAPAGPGPAEAAALRGSLKRRMGGTADYDPESGRWVFREIAEHEVRQIPLGNGRSATFRATRGRRHDRSRRQVRGQGRNQSAAMRDLLAAVAHDLIGCDAFEVGTRVLGALPKAGFDERDSRAWPESNRAWGRGRSILAQLGCWPWVHAEEGKLPRKWRSDQAFIVPLREWVGRETRAPAAASSN